MSAGGPGGRQIRISGASAASSIRAACLALIPLAPWLAACSGGGPTTNEPAQRRNYAAQITTYQGKVAATDLESVISISSPSDRWTARREQAFWIDAPRPVRLIVPFQIVDSVRVLPHLPDDFSRGLPTRIALGDGSAIEGRTHTGFAWRTAGGKSEIVQQSVPTLSFSHRAESSYVFAPHGRHVAVLHGPGGPIELQGAAFVRNRFDEAGSFLGESYVETFDLYVVGERHTLTWSSIAAISLKTDGAPLRVALRDGSTVEGFPDCLVAPNAEIQGSRQMGRYTLAAVVSLCDWTDKTFENLEFRR